MIGLAELPALSMPSSIFATSFEVLERSITDEAHVHFFVEFFDLSRRILAHDARQRGAVTTPSSWRTQTTTPAGVLVEDSGCG